MLAVMFFSLTVELRWPSGHIRLPVWLLVVLCLVIGL